MCDVTKRGLTAAPAALPKGPAFAIADLVVIRGRAVSHDFSMVVRLDHGAEDEDYEEVIAFHVGMNPLCRSIMWRNAEAVCVQPLVGSMQRYDSVAAALESLHPRQRDILTDITAATWPAD